MTTNFNLSFKQEKKFTKCGVCVALKLCLQGTTDKDKRKKKGAQRTTSGSLYSVVLLVNKLVWFIRCHHKLFCTIEFRFPELYWFFQYFENWASPVIILSTPFQVVFSCLGASVYLCFFFFTFQIGVIVICRDSYVTNVFSHVIQGLKEEHIISTV